MQDILTCKSRGPNLEVWVFWRVLESMSIIFSTTPTPAGSPAIRFSSDTNCLELMQTPQLQGSVPQDCPHFRSQCKSWTTCTSDQLAINQGSHCCRKESGAREDGHVPSLRRVPRMAAECGFLALHRKEFKSEPS